MLDIENFKTNILGGLARPSLFQVQLINPIDPSGDLQVPLKAKGAQLPPVTNGEVPVFYMGRKIPLAGDKEFEPWTVTIYNDEDFAVRDALERWSSAINEHQGNVRSRGATSNPASYKSTGIVRQLSKEGSVIPLKEYRCVGMFPQRVGEIELDWENQNQVEVFQVTFLYDYWTSNTTDSFAE